MRSLITTLPTEILLELLRYVACTTTTTRDNGHPAKSILAIAASCKLFYTLVQANDDDVWRHAYYTLLGESMLQGYRSSPLPLSYLRGEPATPQALMSQTKTWKSLYKIHHGWLARKAEAYVYGKETHDQQVNRGGVEESMQETPRQVCIDQYHARTLPLSHHQQQQQQQQQHTWADTCKRMVKAFTCGTTVYSTLVAVPRLKLVVRSNRCLGTDDEENEKVMMMQVLDGRTGQILDVDVENRHRQVVSAMAINNAQDYLASASIDGTVRVWTFTQDWTPDSLKMLSTKAQRSPLQCMHILRHESGWVHDLAIQGKIVISGGGDYTLRVWDASTGEQLYCMTGLYRRHSMGVQTVSIYGSLIATSSPLDQYHIWQTDSLKELKTRDVIPNVASVQSSTSPESKFESLRLLHVLDEPLPSWAHRRFERSEHQHYRTRVVITPVVYITASKLRGMLCVWSRVTGRLFYRIWVAGVSTCGRVFSRLPKGGAQEHMEGQLNGNEGVAVLPTVHDCNFPLPQQYQGTLDVMASSNTSSHVDHLGTHKTRGDIFVDADMYSPFCYSSNGIFRDMEPVGHLLEDGEEEDGDLTELIHDFCTDVTFEFLMVTLSSGRMVLFRFGPSPADRPIQVQPHLFASAVPGVQDTTGWILCTNEQGDLLVDSVIC